MSLLHADAGMSHPPRPISIAVVFKLYGDDWFNRLEEGVKRFAQDTGHNAIATGPPLVDSALRSTRLKT